MDEVDDVLPHIASAKTLGETLDGLFVVGQGGGVLRIEAVDTINITDADHADIAAMFHRKAHRGAKTVTH